MSWKEQLQKGKFREVEFWTESVDNTIGRRSQLHEFPLKDLPFTEDLGRKAREHSFECFVIGDDYMTDRDALIEAFEKAGSGTLIHPFWGTQNVQVTTVRIRENTDEGRLARFSVSFTEAGKNETPAEDSDTASIVDEKVDSGISAAIDDFSEHFGVKGFPAFVADDAVTMLDSALDLIEFGQSAVAAVQTIRDNIETAIHNPFQLATDVSSAIAQASGIESLKAMHNYGQDLADIAQTTASRIKQGDNREAIISLVRSSAVLETARLLV